MQVQLPFWNVSGDLEAEAAPLIDTVIQFWDGTPPRPFIFSNPITCTASGGTPGYSYLWTEVDASPAVPYPSGIIISNPTNKTTTFKADSVVGAFAVTGVFKCTAQDAVGATDDTSDVEINLERTT